MGKAGMAGILDPDGARVALHDSYTILCRLFRFGWSIWMDGAACFSFCYFMVIPNQSTYKSSLLQRREMIEINIQRTTVARFHDAFSFSPYERTPGGRNGVEHLE